MADLPTERYELADDVVPAATQDEVTVDRSGRLIASSLEGVLYERLAPHVDHRGSLVEGVNPSQPFWDEPVVYSYCVTIRPGRIKGWGMHQKQADRYFHCFGQFRVVLYDGRRRSPTFERFAIYHLSPANPGLLLIPPGVWHAAHNWTQEETAVFMNFPTRPFEHGDPDKYRLDPYSGPIGFDWTLPDY